MIENKPNLKNVIKIILLKKVSLPGVKSGNFI